MADIVVLPTSDAEVTARSSYDTFSNDVSSEDGTLNDAASHSAGDDGRHNGDDGHHLPVHELQLRPRPGRSTSTSSSSTNTNNDSNILDMYPEYAQTQKLDRLRATEYSYLDSPSPSGTTTTPPTVYLDYTGASLASHAQHLAHHTRLTSPPLLANPHSQHLPSLAATAHLESARLRVLAHLGADPAEYAAIFTPNASAAARLVAESYPFSPSPARRNRKKRLVLTADNHNSVHGMREYARRARCPTVYVKPRVASASSISSNPPSSAFAPASAFFSLRGGEDSSSSSSSSLSSSSLDKYDGQDDNDPMSLRIATADIIAALGNGGGGGGGGLLAYPAQSNFTGVRHPLSWVSLAQSQGYDVLLDAAAYLPTSTLDLSHSSDTNVHPDFLIVSWYKLFGYPTGLGCLVARREALSRLRRPWFAGGTVEAVRVAGEVGQQHVLSGRVEEAFEDGTVSFLAIPDVVVGLDWIAAVGVETVGLRVRCLTGWFLDRLAGLRHGNGRGMARVYGPRGMVMRGGTVAFSFLDPVGTVVPVGLVGRESAKAGIALRTGCFCNPGCGEAAAAAVAATAGAGAGAGAPGAPVGMRSWRRRRQQQLTKRLQLWTSQEAKRDALLASIAERSQPAVRVSFGIASTAGDVDRFFHWAVATYKDRDCGGY